MILSHKLLSHNISSTSIAVGMTVEESYIKDITQGLMLFRVQCNLQWVLKNTCTYMHTLKYFIQIQRDISLKQLYIKSSTISLKEQILKRYYCILLFTISSFIF